MRSVPYKSQFVTRDQDYLITLTVDQTKRDVSLKVEKIVRPALVASQHPEPVGEAANE